MSRTDKTDPYWVKIARRDYSVKPLHRHYGREFWERGGVCDLADPLPRTRRGRWRGCENWCSSYGPYADKVFGRYPRSRKAWGKDGRARATLRRLKHKWATVDREDIDSFEAAPYQRWLWAKWYWD